MDLDLVVLGTGGHAAVVIDVARSAGWNVTGCVGPAAPSFDDAYCAYLGDDDILRHTDPRTVALAVGVGSTGNAEVRRKLFGAGRELGFEFAKLAHSAAVVAPTATVGEGAQIMAGALVNPFAVVGANAIVNTGAIVEHHVRIGDHAHVAPGAVICGNVTIGEGAHIGAGATVLQNLTIGAAAIIGAGAVVTRPVPTGATVKGAPAR